MHVLAELGRWGDQFGNEKDVMRRLASDMKEIAEGAWDYDLNESYRKIRLAIVGDSWYKDHIPDIVWLNKDALSLKKYIDLQKAANPLSSDLFEAKVAPLLNRAAELDWTEVDPKSVLPIDPAAWTGVQSPSQRLAAARSLIPIAQGSIERLIEYLERGNHNGAPPLDETKEAIENLRKLHASLGSILKAIENGQWDEVKAEGLAAEAVRYGKRAVRTLKDDPMPFTVSTLVLAVMGAIGLPEIGGYLAGVAVSLRKPTEQ